MDKIYSRKRIKIPKLKVFYASKILKVLVIFIIAILTGYVLLKSANPIFENLCKLKASIVATDIINAESNEVLAIYDYKNIVEVKYNEADNANVIQIDVVTINKISSDIALQVNEELKKLENEFVSIPIGAIAGNSYLAGTGPKIKIQIISAGNVTTEIKTEFESKGINQTIYRIYLELTCDLNILTSYNTMKTQVTNQVLLVETVVVGDVPQTYYNLEGVGTEDTLNLID